jgi:hypothetical protein
MLDIALKFVTNELNTYLNTKTGVTSGEIIQLSKIVDEAGKYAFSEGTVAVTIINMEEERIFKAQLPEYRNVKDQHVVMEPELKLNLHILFAANFKYYAEALKYISYVLIYFQSHPSFTSVEYPALDPRIQKMTIELQSLNYEQLNQIWGFIGGKQLPSVIYKVRLLTLQDETQKAIQAPLRTINSDLGR